MKAWEIIGWAHDGALYHDGCEPSEARGEDEAPIGRFQASFCVVKIKKGGKS